MSIATEITRLQTAKNDLKAAIENKGVTVGDGTIDTYAEKVAEIESGGDDSWYDTFWDSFQNFGNRTSYSYAFHSSNATVGAWNKDTFLPKYDFKLDGSSYGMFCYFNHGKEAFDLAKHLEDCGVVLDTSKASSMGAFFENSNITRVPALSLVTNLASLSTNLRIFQTCNNLETVDKLIFPETGGVISSACFKNNYALKNIVIEGVIKGYARSTTNIPSFKDSTHLTVESMKSIISALYDYSGTDEALVYDVVFASGCLAALEAEGNTSPNGNTWLEYARDKGWNI